jgi:hypothetical protein
MPSEYVKEILIGGKPYKDFTIGCDPELRIKGFKPTDNHYMQKEGEFGTDGPNSHICELRPSPKFCPITLTAEIENVMRRRYNTFSKIQDKDWLAGTSPEGHPTGGHIHFNSSYKDSHFELKIEALDKLLAPVVLMLENEAQAKQRRQNTEYGKLAFKGRDHRGWKPEEGYGGFEYRTLPSWLISKNCTSSILALSKTIMFEAHNKSLIRHLFWQLKFANLDSKFESAYNGCNKEFFKPMIPQIFRIVRTFKLYPKYDKWINSLIHRAMLGEQWDENSDLKKRWNMLPKVISTSSEKKILISFDELWNANVSIFGNNLIPETNMVATEAM